MGRKKKSESMDLSRRDLFKAGALLAGGAAAAAIMPTGTAYAQAQDRSACQPEPWEVAPAPIPDSEIKTTVNADVVIIGSGIAGNITAISAKEAGVKNVVIIEKNPIPAARGAHITAFGSRVQADAESKGWFKQPNYRQIIREWVRWAQGRVNEDLLWLFARKSGAAMDWLEKVLITEEKRPFRIGIWSQYYKGPDYTEYPVTHVFEQTETGARGNEAAVKALAEIAEKRGVKTYFRTPSVQLIRPGNKGKVTGVIAGNKGNYTKFVASKAVVIASGDYASDKAMTGRYCPIVQMADAQIYFPTKCNTGDLHKQAMWIGGAMQKPEPHAAVIHLEAGATSYGFLHVNALGKRFKNEDVNTQSKSCSKLFEPNGGVAWTIYDANWLDQIEYQLNNDIAGGLFYGQMARFYPEKFVRKEEEDQLKLFMEQDLGTTKKVVSANSLDDLAKKMGIPAAEFKKTVEAYNKLVASGNDTQFGKRKELLNPIAKPPFYAGKLAATVLTMSGGLHTDTSLRVLDAKDQPIEGLYVTGSTAGDFFAADYPTICPGIGHGRCVTFSYLLGQILGGKSLDSVKSINV